MLDNYNILSQLDIIEIMETLQEETYQNTKYLREVKRTGNNMMITCPYHSGGTEQNVSMGVTIDDNDKSRKGTCHCFTCHITVDLLTLIGFVNGVNDVGQFGNKWVHKEYLIYDNTEERQPIKAFKQKEKVTPLLIPEEEVLVYAEQIPAYIINRGVTLEIADRFNVGYDKEKHSVTFPVYDKDGRCRFIQRRSIDSKYFLNTEGADKDSTLYGIDQLYKELQTGNSGIMELYVVESIIDALYLWSNGKYGVATMQAIPTKAQLKLLNDLPIKTLIAAQDNDNAGIRGALYLRKHLSSKLIKRFMFPDYAKDINDIPSNVLSEIRTTLIF